MMFNAHPYVLVSHKKSLDNVVGYSFFVTQYSRGIQHFVWRC